MNSTGASPVHPLLDFTHLKSQIHLLLRKSLSNQLLDVVLRVCLLSDWIFQELYLQDFSITTKSFRKEDFVSLDCQVFKHYLGSITTYLHFDLIQKRVFLEILHHLSCRGGREELNQCFPTRLPDEPGEIDVLLRSHLVGIVGIEGLDLEGKVEQDTALKAFIELEIVLLSKKLN